MSSQKQTIFVLALFFSRAWFATQQKLSLLGLEPRILFWSFYLFEIFSWFQGLSMQSVWKMVDPFLDYK
jgi:hypothetical protein